MEFGGIWQKVEFVRHRYADQSNTARKYTLKRFLNVAEERIGQSVWVLHGVLGMARRRTQKSLNLTIFDGTLYRISCLCHRPFFGLMKREPSFRFDLRHQAGPKQITKKK